MQELIQELIEEIKRLTEQLQDQNGQLQKQSEQLAALRKEIAEKDALIVALTKRIEELRAFGRKAEKNRADRKDTRGRE